MQKPPYFTGMSSESEREYAREYRRRFPEKSRESVRRYRRNNPEKVRESHYLANRALLTSDPRKSLFYSARKRAKESGLPFEISLDHILLGSPCLLCGKDMKKSTHGVKHDSPTLDKIYPQRGYVPGNVKVICYECNMRKRDWTPETMKDFLEKLILYSK